MRGVGVDTLPEAGGWSDVLLAGTGSDPSESLGAIPGSAIMRPSEEGLWGKKSIGLSGEGAVVGAACAKRGSVVEMAVERSFATVWKSVSAPETSSMEARKYVSCAGFARGKEKVGSRKGKKNAKNAKHPETKDIFTEQQ